MKESGSKVHKIYANTMNLSDFRVNSKLKSDKKILFDLNNR